MTTELRSIGDKIAVRRAAANTAITAGGGGDNSLVTGVILDRAPLAYPLSAVFAIPFTATLAAGATLTISGTVQEGDNAGLSDQATLQTIPATVVATGPVGGGTVTGTFEVNVPLSGAGRYIRVNWTPDLSAAGTDTAAMSAVVVFGGAMSLPV